MTTYSNPQTNTTTFEKYPVLMLYIHSRNTIEKSADWCEQLRKDKLEAEDGGFANLAAEMRQAQADYAAQQQAKGHDGYPYNRAMGEYLGLPIKANGEPDHGYYMASGVMHHFALGAARRKAQELITNGRSLKIVTARSKETRKPVRFATFTGFEQIQITDGSVVISNGKRRGKLSSNWSAETCMQKLVTALESGNAYGE